MAVTGAYHGAKTERKHIEAKSMYKELIKKCTNEIEDMEPILKGCQGTLKEIASQL